MSAVPYTLRIDPHLKKRLDAEAKREKRSTAYVLQQAATDYLDRKEAFHKMVVALEAEADKGVFISEESMSAWVNSWDTDRELPEPEADVFLNTK